MSLPLDVVGLLVGRLKGSMARATGPLGSDQLVDANTIIGDKTFVSRYLSRTISLDAHHHDRDAWPAHDTYHEIVLRSSAQCLPMVKFDRALQDHKEGRQCVQYLQDSLQQIMDRIFNKGMVRSDIRDAPFIITPVSAVRAALSSAPWVPPRASSTALPSITPVSTVRAALSSAPWVLTPRRKIHGNHRERASSTALSSNQQLPGQY